MRRTRSPSSKVTGNSRYKRIRAEILERDNHTCKYCGGHADQVDHVVPVAIGGDGYDPSNLVAACAACNRAKSMSTTAEQVRSTRTRVSRWG